MVGSAYQHDDRPLRLAWDSTRSSSESRSHWPAEGITSVLQGRAQFGTTTPASGPPPTFAVPLLDRIPVLAPACSPKPVLVFPRLLSRRRSLLALPLDQHRAEPACGGREAGGARRGRRQRCLDAELATLSTGALAGVGGAFLSVVAAGIFTPFHHPGPGFMAIVIAMLSRGRPFWVLIGSFLFGITLSLSSSLQPAGIYISTDITHMLPFASIIGRPDALARRSYLPPALRASLRARRPLRKGECRCATPTSPSRPAR